MSTFKVTNRNYFAIQKAPDMNATKGSVRGVWEGVYQSTWSSQEWIEFNDSPGYSPSYTVHWSFLFIDLFLTYLFDIFAFALMDCFNVWQDKWKRNLATGKWYLDGRILWLQSTVSGDLGPTVMLVGDASWAWSQDQHTFLLHRRSLWRAK